MKKYLLLALALLLALVSLFSCNTNGSEDASSDVTEVTTLENIQSSSPSSLTVKAVDGQLNFRVVRPDLATVSDQSVKTASAITQALSSTFNAKVSIGTDFLKAGSSHDDSAFEILVGLTNYPESQKWTEVCNYGDYVIAVEGNKIVITALSEHCLMTAGNVFVSMVNRAYNKDENSATLKSDVVFQHNVFDEQLAALPVFDGGTLLGYYDAGNRTVSSKSQCDEIIIEKASEEAFSAYLEKLTASGFTKRCENTIQNSLFATFTNEKYMISAGYYSADKSVRLLIEQSYDISAFTESKPYTKVCDSLLTLIGLEYQNPDNASSYVPNGLSILIRLEDGRFIIVDGGFNRTEQADHLIRTMRAQSSEYTETPTVAAWIITHAHGDHEGLFISHSSRFKSVGIKIENVIANMMSDIEVKKAIEAPSPDFEDNEGQRGAKLLSTADKLGATVYKAHVGQKYRFANLKFDVIYTLESFAPSVCNALNTASVVTKMTFSDSVSGKESTLLCTGDATGAAMETLHRMFGSYIKSDMLQICHHGGGTAGNDRGTSNAYKTVNASLILWPLGLHSYSNYVGRAYNQVVFDQPNYVECYFAGSQGDTVTFTLPYVAGETEISINCIGNCPVSHDYNENTKK